MPRGTKVGHLWIKDCAVEACPSDGSRWHYHRPNPRGQAMKSTEMTVRRALAIIEVFDGLEPGQDWTDCNPKDLRDAMGETFDPRQAIFPELWLRYRNKSLHQTVRELADNLNMEDLSEESRKEIRRGLKRIAQAK